jgi:hypothetical protein
VQGAFQVLIRLQYLRTLLQAWRRVPACHERGRTEELLQGLRGLHAATRAVGLAAYGQMCQRATESLGLLHAGRGVPPHVLGRLTEWLAASERHVRHPQDQGACQQLQLHAERMAAEARGALR